MQYENVKTDLFAYQRKSYMKLGEIFFWTATINNWQRLLTEDKYKEVIISSLEYLSNEKLMDVFAFVIIPNHIHLIWRINKMNGKESPQGSFLKYTAHLFKKMLKENEAEQLNKYKSDAVNKSFEFWQRDSLAILLYSKDAAVQKLKYIHNNPLAEHWQLVADPADYKYCSAGYYEKNKKQFGFLKDLYNEF